MKMKMKNKIFAVYVIIAGIFWGTSCVFVNKLSAMGLSPMECTAIRMVVGAVVLNALLAIRSPRSYRMRAGGYLLCAVSGLFSVLSMCIFYYYCMVNTSAAVSVILLYTAPIFVMIMSVLFLGERFTPRKIAAFVIAIVGCALVSGVLTDARASFSGIIFGVLSGFTYSLYGIFADIFLKKYGKPLAFSALSFAFAALGALIIVRPEGLIRTCATAESLPTLLIFFVCFGLCTAVLPFLFYTKGLMGVRPDVASILAFAEPLTAVILGATALGQGLGAWQAVGMALVVCAILMLNVGRPKG